jgi:hypothetical protein
MSVKQDVRKTAAAYASSDRFPLHRRHVLLQGC